MRLGLIGCSNHWRSYAGAMQHLPDLEVVGVAPAAPDERPAQFDGAPGVTAATRRYEAPEALLAAGMDAVQVSTRADCAGRWLIAAMEQGIPVMAEKPLAFSLEELSRVHQVAQRTSTPVCAMHGQRGTPLVAAVHDVVQRGAIGRPLVAHNQKSYKWGSRPEAYRDRRTFPGIAPWIGVHALDWVLWILGDRFETISGYESTAAHPDYPACASHAAYLLGLRDMGMATLTLDYLRPATAPTHGDERIRIAGTEGVVDISTGAGTGTLINGDGVQALETTAPLQWYAGFLRAAVNGEPAESASHVLPQWEVFRATEVALKTQLAADTGATVDLRETTYR